jgi:hypothetical protein
VETSLVSAEHVRASEEIAARLQIKPGRLAIGPNGCAR